LIISAPAKINLTLEVTGVESNGYHTLDTLFAWLELEDELRLEQAKETSLSITSENVSTEFVTSGPDNLVLRAHAALERLTGRRLPTQFGLLKRIPAGGGLGGGSADAAATLVGLNRLFELGLSQEELLRVAAPLGADVSFGLVGGIARGTNYGDKLEPLPVLKELSERTLVLVLPGFACPTPEVYSLWDRSPTHRAGGATDRFLLAGSTDGKLSEIANDLEEPAFRLQPTLRDLKDEMRSLGLEGVCLSGSGSTLFGFLPLAGEVGSVQQAFSGRDVRVCKTKLKEDARLELVS
jgi:4-diphosphocytidyl-2-C-methyl-D-erythritol kinase